MKTFKEYIITESSTTSVINKIKADFKKEFDNKVTIGSGKANYTQIYDVYVYEDDIEILKKVNEILKKHIPKYVGFTDEQLKEKLDNKHEFLTKYNETLDRFPIEFFRFTSRDIKNTK